MAALIEIGGGTSASLEDGRSVFGLAALVTMSCGCPRALDGVNRGEAEEADCLDDDDMAGDEVREGVLLLLTSFISSSASSCLTEFAAASSSISTSIEMPWSAVSALTLSIEVVAEGTTSMTSGTLKPSLLAVSRVFARPVLESLKNLMWATAPRRTLTRWHFELASSRCLGGSNFVRSSISYRKV